MTIIDSSWREEKKWLDFDEEKLHYKPKDDAPAEVKEGYKRYLEQTAAAKKRGAL